MRAEAGADYLAREKDLVARIAELEEAHPDPVSFEETGDRFDEMFREKLALEEEKEAREDHLDRVEEENRVLLEKNRELCDINKLHTDEVNASRGRIAALNAECEALRVTVSGVPLMVKDEPSSIPVDPTALYEYYSQVVVGELPAATADHTWIISNPPEVSGLKEGEFKPKDIPSGFPLLSEDDAKDPVRLIKFLEECVRYDQAFKGGFLNPSMLGYFVLLRLETAKHKDASLLSTAGRSAMSEGHRLTLPEIAHHLYKKNWSEALVRHLLFKFLSRSQVKDSRTGAIEEYASYFYAKVVLLVSFRRVAPTEDCFPTLTRRHFLMIVMAGIHPDVLGRAEAQGISRGEMVKLHRLLLTSASTERIVFETSALPSGGLHVLTPPSSGDKGGEEKVGGADKKKLGGRPSRPKQPAVAPEGFRFMLRDEYFKKEEGKCNRCGKSDHKWSDCPMPRQQVVCVNHPKCNFQFPHVTAMCRLVKLG